MINKDRKEKREMKRNIKIFFKDEFPFVFEKSIISNMKTQEENYSVIEKFISGYQETLYKRKIEKIFIECLYLENIQEHFIFCRNCAIKCKVPFVTGFNGVYLQITEKTPEDWLDISFSDAYSSNERKCKIFGPDYIELSAEQLKMNIFLSKKIIEQFEELITNTLQHPEQYRDYKTFTEHGTETYKNIFTEQHKMMIYYNRLKKLGEEYTEEDDIKLSDEIKKKYGI